MYSQKEYYHINKAQKLSEKMEPSQVLYIEKEIQLFNDKLRSIFDSEPYISKYVNQEINHDMLIEFENDVKNYILETEKINVNTSSGISRLNSLIESEQVKRFKNLLLHKLMFCFYTFAKILLKCTYKIKNYDTDVSDKIDKYLELVNMFLRNCFTPEDLKILITICLRFAKGSDAFKNTKVALNKDTYYDVFEHEIYVHIFHYDENRNVKRYISENRLCILDFEINNKNYSSNLSTFKDILSDNSKNNIFYLTNESGKKFDISQIVQNTSLQIIDNVMLSNHYFYKIIETQLSKNKYGKDCLKFTIIDEKKNITSIDWNGITCVAVCLELNNNCTKFGL
jgi:hypothetical protein